MSNIYRLRKTANKLNVRKEDVRTRVPALLGLPIGGQRLVEVPTRESYHYARIRGNLNEVAQVFNAKTSPVYDLPVLISYRNNRWEVEGVDTGRYSSWSSTAYVAKHGAQHSFDPDGAGGDITWVWDNQMMPLAPYPSGSSGAGNILIERYPYWSTTNEQWQYAGRTGTASLLPYKPTGTSARMVLVYVDVNGNPQLLGGSTYFAATITGASAILNYVPDLPSNDDIPVCAIRLVSGTSAIVWNNIYGLRPWFTSAGTASTGSSSTDEKVKVSSNDTTAGYLNGKLVEGAGISLTEQNDGSNENLKISFTGTASVTLDKGEFAYGSNTNTVTSNDHLWTTGSSAGGYQSVHFNTRGDTLGWSRDFSFNVGRGSGSINNTAVWAYGGNTPRSDFFYGAGTEAIPDYVDATNVLGAQYFWGYSYLGLISAPYWIYGAVFRAVANENFDQSYGTYFEFAVRNTGTTNAGSSVLGGLLLYSNRAIFNGMIETPRTGVSGYYWGDLTITGTWRAIVANERVEFQYLSPSGWITQGYSNTGSAGAGSQGPAGPPGDNTLLIYDDSTFKITGSALSFAGNLGVAITGSTGYVFVTGLDASQIDYNPGDPADWPVGPTPSRVDSALDQLADRVLGLETGSASIGKVYISANDTTAGYLNGKLVEGAGISLVENNNGGNETLSISYTGSAGSQGPPGSPGSNTVLIYDDSVFKVTGSAISFDNNLSVAVTGSTAFVSASGGSGDSTYTNTFANRPSGTVNDGDLFFPDDGVSIYRVTGSNSIYKPFGPIFPFVTPVSGDFSWINQDGVATYTDYGGIYLFAPQTSGTNLRILKKTAPSVPYTITAWFYVHQFNYNYQYAGLCWRASASGKLVVAGVNKILLGIDKFTDQHTYSAAYSFPILVFPGMPLCFQLIDDNTNRIIKWSVNGQDFMTLHTIGRTDFATMDEVGFFADPNNATYGCGIELLSWKES